MSEDARHLALYLLGPSRLEREGRPVEIDTRKNMALLAYLAVTGESHSREALITLLWPELEPKRARANLRRNLSVLKKVMGSECLAVDRKTIGLDSSDDLWLDVDQFRQLLRDWQIHGHAEAEVCPDCLAALAEAAELYRGDFLAGFSLRDSPEFDEWQFFQAEGLRQELAAALERLIRGHSAQGAYETAIPYARRWLALDPLHEPVHWQLMGLYAQAGQRAAALRQYEECARILDEELGLPPGEETTRLYQAIKERQALPPLSGGALPASRRSSDQRSRKRAAPAPERYRLEREIGLGAMGEVWLATDTLLDRPVAIKRPKLAHEPLQRERFLAEARMLARLNHPHITQIYDAFVDPAENRFYLVMEYVAGKDLKAVIEGGPIPLEASLEVALGVLRALSYAHEQGVVHRDVKPGNVMIAAEVKLTDFGLANLISLLQRGTGFMAGTPAYMAPEQIEGRPTDGRADLYALGVMLFEMISGGRLPFEYTDEDEMLEAHLHLPPPPLSRFVPDIPPALEQIITRLLAKDAAERYPSAEALLQALSTYDRQAGEAPSQPAEKGEPATPRHNLPAQTTPCLGRESELADLDRLLAAPAIHLVTVLGPGGMGKTRLALEVALAQLERFEHGVYLVSLAALESPAGIVPTIARALGFSFYEESAPEQQLCDYLRQKQVLLVLDNFEHLLAGVDIVAAMLEAAPGLKVLATSRARLNLQAEQLYPIAGIAYPGWETPEDAAGYSAVKLFVQSARRVQPGFELTDDDLIYVSRICRLVQGMPLGILLAAAWVELLSPAEIAAEIGQSLDFLETDLRDVPDRQRSMRAVFDHSWQLLTEREREVFQALSVFRGGFTRQAAQEVTGASLRELIALVNKSLLQRASTGRYEIHELLRQYAEEKLDGSPAASEAMHNRHSAYYAAALQEWGADLKGPRQQTALAEMDAEIENARVAWNWAVERGQVGRLDQAVDGLCRFYAWRGRIQEAEAVCRKAVEKLEVMVSGDGLRVLAKVLSVRGNFDRLLGRTDLASQILQQSLALLERPELVDHDIRLVKAYALMEMGDIASDSDREEAGRLYAQSLTLLRALDDQWGTAQALFALGEVVRNRGAYGKAKQLHEESLAIRQALGDQRTLAASLMGLGTIALYQGQVEEAERLVREGIAIRREIGDMAGIADGLRSLGVTLLRLGKFVEAHSLLEESVAVFSELGLSSNLALSWLCFAKGHLGLYKQARAQVQMVLTTAREIGDQRGIGDSLFILGLVALARGAYAEAQELLQESVAVYQELGQREKLGQALGALGAAARGLSQLPQARRQVYEALCTTVEIRAIMPLMLALAAKALLLADQGDTERAVELYALLLRYPIVANSRWWEDLFGRHIATVAATLPPDVVAAAQARGEARDLWATAEELMVELAPQHDPDCEI